MIRPDLLPVLRIGEWTRYQSHKWHLIYAAMLMHDYLIFCNILNKIMISELLHFGTRLPLFIWISYSTHTHTRTPARALARTQQPLSLLYPVHIYTQVYHLRISTNDKTDKNFPDITLNNKWKWVHHHHTNSIES